MLSSRSYWLLFLTFLVVAIIAAWGADRYDRMNGSAPQFTKPPRIQNTPLKLEELSILGAAASPVPPSAVRGPARLEAGPDGHLFVIDDGDGQAVKEFSPSAELLRIFRGPGIPRIASVTDLSILTDRLWIADLRESSIHTLNRLTGTWATTRLDPAPYRLEPVGQGQRLFLMRIVAPSLFDVASPTGKVLGSFGSLLDEQEFHSLALDGFITRSRSQIIFSGKYMGFLASFSEDGRTLWISRAIDPPENPIVMEKAGRRWVQRGPLSASLAVTADADTVCVLARRVSGLHVRSFLDLYRTEDGQYYKSLLLPSPDRWTSVAAARDLLYVANQQGIFQWPKEVLEANSNTGTQSAGRSVINFLDVQKGESS